MSVKRKIKQLLNKANVIRIVREREVSVPYVINLDKKGRLKGKVAVVTGGSGVIGRAIAFRLAAEGAKVYVCGSKREKAEPIADEILQAGFQAIPFGFNITDENSTVTAFNQIIEDSKHIDILVCCAGGGAREEMKPFINQSMSVIDSVINTNLRGTILSTREASRQMVSQKSGNIVIISSTVGICGMPAYSEYAVAKAGLMALVKSLAMELGKNGIRINCVTPGIVERGIIDDIKLERIHKTNWLNGYGKPEDIAGMVAYLNTEEASFITGQNFVVDGGRSLGLKNN